MIWFAAVFLANYMLIPFLGAPLELVELQVLFFALRLQLLPGHQALVDFRIRVRKFFSEMVLSLLELEN